MLWQGDVVVQAVLTHTIVRPRATANEHGIAYAQLLTDARHVALLKALQTVTPNLLDHGSTMPKTLVFTNSADTAEAATAFLHGLRMVAETRCQTYHVVGLADKMRCSAQCHTG